jgi:uncharacterized protein
LSPNAEILGASQQGGNMKAPNTVGWIQVGTDDPETVKRFYGELFGWTYTTDPDSAGKYDLVSGGDAPFGGVFNTDGNSPNHAIFLVVVADVAATVRQAERAGGKVLVPPTTTASGLVFADLLDPSGNHFGVYTPA